MEEELFPIVDTEGNTIGKAPRSYCHSGTKVLHPVVHLHVFNKKGKLFLQKRSLEKDIQPGKWDTAVGGHIDYGEKVEDALIRESREELGIVGFDPLFVTKYLHESSIEKEMVYVFKTVWEGPFQLNENEITEGRFWEIAEIESCLTQKIFTPNFEYDFTLLKEWDQLTGR